MNTDGELDPPRQVQSGHLPFAGEDLAERQLTAEAYHANQVEKNNPESAGIMYILSSEPGVEHVEMAITVYGLARLVFGIPVGTALTDLHHMFIRFVRKILNGCYYYAGQTAFKNYFRLQDIDPPVVITIFALLAKGEIDGGRQRWGDGRAWGEKAQKPILKPQKTVRADERVYYLSTDLQGEDLKYVDCKNPTEAARHFGVDVDGGRFGAMMRGENKRKSTPFTNKMGERYYYKCDLVGGVYFVDKGHACYIHHHFDWMEQEAAGGGGEGLGGGGSGGESSESFRQSAPTSLTAPQVLSVLGAPALPHGLGLVVGGAASSVVAGSLVIVHAVPSAIRTVPAPKGPKVVIDLTLDDGAGDVDLLAEAMVQASVSDDRPQSLNETTVFAQSGSSLSPTGALDHDAQANFFFSSTSSDTSVSSARMKRSDDYTTNQGSIKSESRDEPRAGGHGRRRQGPSDDGRRRHRSEEDGPQRQGEQENMQQLWRGGPQFERAPETEETEEVVA